MKDFSIVEATKAHYERGLNQKRSERIIMTLLIVSIFHASTASAMLRGFRKISYNNESL